MNVSLETQRETAVIHRAGMEKAADRRMKTMHHQLNAALMHLNKMLTITCKGITENVFVS